MKLTEVYNRREDLLIILKREREMAEKIKEADFSAPATFSVSNMGKGCIRISISPENEDGARILAGEIGKIFNLVWKTDIRDYEGKFFYMGDAKGYFEKWDDLFVLIENAPAPANCKIVKKTKKVEYFEKVCN